MVRTVVRRIGASSGSSTAREPHDSLQFRECASTAAEVPRSLRAPEMRVCIPTGASGRPRRLLHDLGFPSDQRIGAVRLGPHRQSRALYLHPVAAQRKRARGGDILQDATNCINGRCSCRGVSYPRLRPCDCSTGRQQRRARSPQRLQRTVLDFSACRTLRYSSKEHRFEPREVPVPLVIRQSSKSSLRVPRSA